MRENVCKYETGLFIWFLQVGLACPSSNMPMVTPTSTPTQPPLLNQVFPFADLAKKSVEFSAELERAKLGGIDELSDNRIEMDSLRYIIGGAKEIPRSQEMVMSMTKFSENAKNLVLQVTKLEINTRLTIGKIGNEIVQMRKSISGIAGDNNNEIKEKNEVLKNLFHSTISELKTSIERLQTMVFQAKTFSAFAEQYLHEIGTLAGQSISQNQGELENFKNFIDSIKSWVNPSKKKKLENSCFLLTSILQHTVLTQAGLISLDKKLSEFHAYMDYLDHSSSKSGPSLEVQLDNINASIQILFRKTDFISNSDSNSNSNSIDAQQQ